MNATRLEINLDKIKHNATTLIDRLAVNGISVTGITKSILGSAEIVNTLLSAGMNSIGDSRIENIENMRQANVDTSMILIRSPMLSQVRRVVANVDISFNTELDVISQLSNISIKLGRIHGIELMVELGDLREGIMPADIHDIVRKVLRMPAILIKGIGTNLACHNGVSPDNKNMSQLSALADSLESTFGIHLDIISGGNSANLDWALDNKKTGRINNLRLGESLLLGCETLHRQAIKGLHTDAITLTAEVIESKIKPSQPWGTIAQNAFGEFSLSKDHGNMMQSILAIGRQDIDSQGLIAPHGTTIIDSSSDHLMVRCDRLLAIGTELQFQVNYSALTRAMTSPFVEKKIIKQAVFLEGHINSAQDQNLSMHRC